MRIAVGADHRGAEAIKTVILTAQQHGHIVNELGACGTDSIDYPDRAYPVAAAVAHGDADLGVLVCGSGIGMSIAANKVCGVRAALVQDEVGADVARRYVDANVLCLPADLISHRLIERIVKTWLTAAFEGGRHARRITKIAAIEGGRSPADILDEEVQGQASPV